jgi:NAD-dependent dihydropyrimidine dehydrogenase PreA subunit
MGYGWISGPAIRPLALRIVAEAARSVKIPVIGVGGVMSGRDAIEFFMAGASAVQICTGAILEGPGIYGRVAREIERWLKQHGYDSVEDIRGVALRYLPKEPVYDVGYAVVDESKCKACGFCEKVCRYDAVHVKDVGGYEVAVVDSDKCYGCGMCVSICPERAINFSRRWI